MQDVSTRNFKVIETYREAWKLVHGTKWPIWGTTLILYIPGIALMIPFIMAMVKTTSHASFNPSWLSIIGLVIGFILIVPGMFAAAGKIVLERVRGNTIYVKTGLRAFWHRFIPVTLTLAIAYAIIVSPLAIGSAYFASRGSDSVGMTILFGIYILLLLLLGALFSMSLFFAVDKTLNPFAAIFRSVKVVYPHFWRVLGLLIISELISFAFQIPMKLGDHFHIEALGLGGSVFFFIAMIWIMPWQFLAFGLTYHKLVD